MLQSYAAVSYTPRPKKINYRLVPGSVIESFANWQKQLQPEGKIELIEFHRHFGEFYEQGEVYLGERWRVRFVGTDFYTHRFIRVKRYRIS